MNPISKFDIMRNKRYQIEVVHHVKYIEIHGKNETYIIDELEHVRFHARFKKKTVISPRILIEKIRSGLCCPYNFPDLIDGELCCHIMKKSILFLERQIYYL